MVNPGFPVYFPFKKLFTEWRGCFGEHGGREFFWSVAPGRVNLIGEHTDYHNGFVLPVAIDLKTYILAAPRDDGLMRCASLNIGETAVFDIEDLAPDSVKGWSRYVAASAWAFMREGFRPRGIDAVVWGTVPFGGGLSSSASLEVAFIHLFDIMREMGLSPRKTAELGKLAENEFVGVPCGIMDQYVAAACEEGGALRIDCESLETNSVPIPKDWRIVVCDTGVKHELAQSEYGRRQDECRAGLSEIRKRYPEAVFLRDVDYDMLENAKPGMTELSYRRCRYVLEENERVSAFSKALEEGDAKKAGLLMARSHAGLSSDYEVSCEELDRAVEMANGIPGLVGARMTGGGFGGCTVNLVWAEEAERFRERLESEYREYSGGRGRALVLTPGGGMIGGSLGDIG